MAKSAIYTVASSAQSVTAGGAVAVGNVIRRYGQNITTSGDGVMVNGAGYYLFNISITAAPAAAGSLTVQAYKDGVAIPGAYSTFTTAATDTEGTISLTFITREACPCCDSASVISLQSDSAATVSNVALTAVKL